MRTFMFADDLPVIEPNLEATKYYYNNESKRFEIEDDFDDDYDPNVINNKLPSDLPKLIVQPVQAEEPHTEQPTTVPSVQEIYKMVNQQESTTPKEEKKQDEPKPNADNISLTTEQSIEIEVTDSTTQGEESTISLTKLTKRKTFVSSVDVATQHYTPLEIGYKPILGALPTDSQLGPHNDEYFQMFTNNKAKILADKKTLKNLLVHKRK